MEVLMLTIPKTEELIKDFGPLVSKICRRMISDKAAAEDAAQEVWMEIIKSLPTFQGKSKLSTWIFTIARRTVARYAQKEMTYTRQMVNSFFNLDEIPCPHSSLPEKKAWVKESCDNCFTAGYHCLSNEARLEKILKDIAGLSFEEIARILDKDVQSIRKSVVRSRAKLKNFLTKDCAILNPEGTCRCRIKKVVYELDLNAEYQKLRVQMKNQILPKIMEQFTPKINYWEKRSQ